MFSDVSQKCSHSPLCDFNEIFSEVIFKLMFAVDGWSSSCETTFWSMFFICCCCIVSSCIVLWKHEAWLHGVPGTNRQLMGAICMFLPSSMILPNGLDNCSHFYISGKGSWTRTNVTEWRKFQLHLNNDSRRLIFTWHHYSVIQVR